MQFFNLLIAVYIVYYTINILLDLAKSKGARSSTIKSQPVEFAISAPAPPKSVYEDAPIIEKQQPTSAYQPQPKETVSKSNDQPNDHETPTSNPITIYESDKAILFKKADIETRSPEPTVNMVSALNLEVISDSVEVTEEQLEQYAIPF